MDVDGTRRLALQGPQCPWAPQAHRKCLHPDSGADGTGRRTVQLGVGRGTGSIPAAQRDSLPLAASAGDPVTQASPHVWVQEPNGTEPSPTPHGLLATPSPQEEGSGAAETRRWEPGLGFQEPGPGCPFLLIKKKTGAELACRLLASLHLTSAYLPVKNPGHALGPGRQPDSWQSSRL